MNNSFIHRALILPGFVLAFGVTAFVHAQGEIGSGTIQGSGSGTFTYDLTFSDAAGATSPIGSIWYSWVPGFFYLPGVPSAASAPSGWTATVFGNSVQYVANAATNDIVPGQSLSGFGYTASFTPAQLAAAPNSGVSVAYAGGLQTDPGNTFSVQTVVPEPSEAMLLFSGAGAFWFVRRRGAPRRLLSQ